MKIINVRVSHTRLKQCSSKFAVKIVRPKVYKYVICQSDNLDLHARSQMRLKVDNMLMCSLIVISRTLFCQLSMAFKFGMAVDLCMPCMLILISMILNLKAKFADNVHIVLSSPY